jgi:hypothetical protein
MEIGLPLIMAQIWEKICKKLFKLKVVKSQKLFQIFKEMKEITVLQLLFDNMRLLLNRLKTRSILTKKEKT